MIPKILKNFNLFIDGRGYAGRVEEIVLPRLSLRTEEHRVGGMDIPIELDMGMNKLECDFTLSEYDPEVLKVFGLSNGAQVPLTLRGGLTDESRVVPVMITLHGAWREVDFGTWRAGEKAPLKVSVAARYYRLEIDGKPLVEIDAVNMVRVIDGKDQLKDLRGAMGL